MRFQDALAQNLPPERVGQVHFWYESGRLWAEWRGPAPRRRVLDVLLLVAFGSTLLALLALLVPTLVPGGVTTALVLAMLAGGSALVAARLQAAAGRHRFVLDFSAEAMTLERYSRGLGPARRTVIPFDDVVGMQALHRANDQYDLMVRFRVGGRVREELLVPEVPADERDALQTVWRVLHNAFGLRPVEADDGAEPAPEPDPGNSPEEGPPDRFDPGPS